MSTRMKQCLEIWFGFVCLFAMWSSGCIAPGATDDSSGGFESATDDEVDSAETSAAIAAAPVGCIGGSPTSGAFVNCFYDAPDLVYTDGWKCSPPGDQNEGHCKTSTVGKKVSFTFFTQQNGFIFPGIFFEWRPSAAQGTVRVRIDGVDVGSVWQGEDSPGYKSYALAAGLHTIELIKPARDSGRFIAIRFFGNGR